MALLRVLLGFADASDHVVEETAGHLLDGLYQQSTSFPAPPVEVGDLEEALGHFTAAIAAQKEGGPAATAAKQVAGDALIGMLRRDALYVQTVVQGIADPAEALAALLSSGFDAVSTSRTQHPLATPGVRDIQNVGAGRLRLGISAVANARLYEVRSKSGTGDWVSAGMFTNSRAVVVTGLTPGTTYTFQVRAMGGSTGASEWSDPVSHMSL